MTRSEQATVVIAALALRLVTELVSEQLGAEGSLAALTLARGEDAAAQRPPLELARQLLAVLDKHFTRVAPLAPAARFSNLTPYVGQPRLSVAYNNSHLYIAQLEQGLRELTARHRAIRDLLDLANDTIAHLEHGLEAVLESVRGGDLDAALRNGSEVLRGAAR